jgi:hypothetical protein
MPTPAFRDWVDRARSVHVNAIFAAHHIVLPGKGSKRAGPCPKCGGDDRFAVDLGKELFNCRGCNAKGHGAISLEQFIAGQSFLQAVETITGEPPPQDEPKEQKPRSRKPRGKFVCAYSYVDERDVERYQVCRYADPKSFSQRRPDPDRPGEWINNLATVRMVPYRLPDLVEGIANSHPVYWCEGEKDADNGAALGLVTTTTAMGTAGKGFWQRGAYDEFFRDADVILVPDQDDDAKKGAELARIIGKRLKSIAARVRVLNLPNAKDLSLWIEAGGTREQFDALPLSEFATPNGANGHAEGLSDFAQVWEVPPPIGEPAPPAQIVEPTIYVLPDPAKIPRRCWLYAMHYMRKVVTATVAPGGFGKTTLALYEAISMIGLGHRVWYVSGEDDKDEIDRRIAAHCKQRTESNGRITRKEITAADIAERLFVDDKMTFPFKIAKSSRNGPDFDTSKLDAFELAILERNIDVIILDPFVSFHFLPENDTAAMDALIKRLGEICVRCNCCIEISHHVRKPGIGQYEITVYDARGAAAIVNAVRSCRVINQMSLIEAQQAKIEKPASYIRIDSGKRNMAPPEKAHWLHLISVPIANGDHVQAIESYEFKPEQITQQDDNWLILTMTNGKAYRADSRSPDWLGHAIAKHFNRVADNRGDVKWVNNQIATWMTPASHRPHPLLRKVMREDKDRKERMFFELVENPNATRNQTAMGPDDERQDDID